MCHNTETHRLLQTGKYIHLLYKHQWNTRWPFAQKLDIFTCENNMLSSHVKISPLLWLHNNSCLSHQKTIKVKWFGISLVFIIINRTLHGCLEIWNFSSRVEKIFHPFAALTCEIFFDTQREISDLCEPCNILYISRGKPLPCYPQVSQTMVALETVTKFLTACSTLCSIDM